MSLTTDSLTDLDWMINEEEGEEVVYLSSSNPAVTVKAIVDRSAVGAPEMGYENKLEEKHHQFTFVRSVFDFVPDRGDQIEYDGQTYDVDHVYPDETDFWIIDAR